MMQLLSATVVSASLIAASASGFLSESGKMKLDASRFQSEISEAMGMALGCGGQVGEKDLVAIEQEMQPIWRSLHKVSEDRIDRRSLRYLVHRFFDRRSALHIRGFEPSRPVNSSGWGDVDIFSQRVPAYVEAVLESKHRTVNGFELRDAAYMVATIKQLIFDSEGNILQNAYRFRSIATTRSVSVAEVTSLVSAYLVHWFVGDDDESIRILLSNQSLLESSIPHWDKLVSMGEGQARALEYERRTQPLNMLRDGASRPGHNAFVSQFSYEDVHRMVGSITTSFAAFWESECQSMKKALVDMDTHHTGRVPLSKFYGSALDTEWRFGESETYLRELGAIDETSSRGKQVMIANYIQGASNCIVSSTHYLVCCVNECEALLGELEEAVGGPVASTEQILNIVSTSSSISEELSPASTGVLSEQLEKIAVQHDGRVPLHGRLFAQWLHYAFPRECTFPHKAGTASKLTPMEYGDQYLAQNDDMKLQALNNSDLPIEVGQSELQWMSQWSEEEELVSDQAMRNFRAPWEKRGYAASAAMLLLVVVALALVRSKGKGAQSPEDWPSSKSHFV